MPSQRRGRGREDCVLVLKSEFIQVVHNENAKGKKKKKRKNMHFPAIIPIFQDFSVFGPSLLFHGHHCSRRHGSGWIMQGHPQAD